MSEARGPRAQLWDRREGAAEPRCGRAPRARPGRRPPCVSPGRGSDGRPALVPGSRVRPFAAHREPLGRPALAGSSGRGRPGASFVPPPPGQTRRLGGPVTHLPVEPRPAAGQRVLAEPGRAPAAAPAGGGVQHLQVRGARRPVHAEVGRLAGPPGLGAADPCGNRRGHRPQRSRACLRRRLGRWSPPSPATLGQVGADAHRGNRVFAF